MVREHSVAAFYDCLRASAISSPSSPVLLFPSTCDTGALCALKIATHLLAQDSIRYSVYPVASFSDIPPLVASSLSSADQSLVVLLINWGCSRDLRRFLKLGSRVRVFVIDSHRPIHLHNLSDRNCQITVLHTREDETQADMAYDFDVAALANACDLSRDDESEDLSDDDDSGDEGNRRDGRREKRRTGDNDGDAEGDAADG